MTARILLLEEDQALREELSGLLVGRGFRVRAVGTARAAEEALAATVPDVVVAHLPADAGEGLVVALRAVADHARVVLVAGMDRDADALLALSAEIGATAVVYDPCPPAELLARVQQALEPAPARLAPTSTADLRPLAIGAPIARLWLFDDNQARATAVARIGAERRIRIAAADHVEEALARLGSQRPDGALIAWDPDAPEAAAELARRLRSRRGLEDLPLALLHPSAAAPDRAFAIHAGATRVLASPPTGEQLAEVAQHFAATGREEPPSVLVASGSPGLAVELAHALDGDGLTITVLPEPERVLDALEDVRPECLLLDMDTPVLGGATLCRALRAAEEWAELPIVLVTAQTSLEARLSAVEAGADDVVAAPVVREDLVARIRQRVARARQLRDRANRDALTGLWLRRTFTEDVEERLNEARRRGRPLSICLLDIDHFKQVNDTYGHLAGDRVLAGLGRMLTVRLRRRDVRGRWGGEEFAVAVTGEDAAGARAVLERVLAEYRGTVFEGDRGEYFQSSFSAGIATFPDEAETLTDLVRVADERLYRAKNAGRSRIDAG